LEKKNGELVSSAIYTINQEDVNFLRDSVTDDYFSSTNNLKNCLDKDLEWGALAIKKGNKYNLVYTCGGSSSTADRLFDELLERIGNG